MYIESSFIYVYVSVCICVHLYVCVFLLRKKNIECKYPKMLMMILFGTSEKWFFFSSLWFSTS